MAVTTPVLRPLRVALLTGIAMFAACGGQGEFLPVMIHDPDLHTSMEVLADGGLLKELGDRERTFTVFAPNEAAYDAFGRDAFLELAQDKATVARLAGMQVIEGRRWNLSSLRQAAEQQLVTIDGQLLAVEVADGEVFVNGAKIVRANIGTVNGVIHSVDRLLLPPDLGN